MAGRRDRRGAAGRGAGGGRRRPARGGGDLLRRLRRRSVQPLHEGAGADRLAGHPAAVDRLHAQREDRRLRVPGADPARHARHDDADLGRRLHRALSRPRADEPVALRHRRLSARRPARLGGGAQVFRPRRAVVGHAALRRVAGLRLRRHGVVRRRPPRRCTATAASASSSASSSSSPASRSRSRRCRSTCGRPTSTKARRPR